jgi:hypothetical protein
MNKLILLCFIFQSVSAFSQDDNNSSVQNQPVVINFKTYGYIGGKRLDSVDAQFAEFSPDFENVTFDYGQHWAKRKELRISDNKGTPLLFPTTQMAFILNFFYFNGWQPSQTYIKSGESFNILKKN